VVDSVDSLDYMNVQFGGGDSLNGYPDSIRSEPIEIDSGVVVAKYRYPADRGGDDALPFEIAMRVLVEGAKCQFDLLLFDVEPFFCGWVVVGNVGVVVGLAVVAFHCDSIPK
jgi:hypothetical protein